MNITSLGHAGFLVETPCCLFLMDPWLSSTGAYDAAWFQYPCNHHLEQPLLARLRNTNKSLYVYLSHEHQDHYDLEFLSKISDFNLNFILPQFSTKAFESIAHFYPADNITCLSDRQTLAREDFSVTIFLEESGLNRDSAILFQTQKFSFLNFNDCKIFDRLNELKSIKIDVFTTQFSGATWHPICYKYNVNEYRSISADKRLKKFNNVARAINILQPAIFIPSAGPCCFLGNDLFYLNFDNNGIFPTSEEFLDWLNENKKLYDTRSVHLLPGDRLTLPNGQIEITEQPYGYRHRSKQEYLLSYERKIASSRQSLFNRYTVTDPTIVFQQLQHELQLKCREIGIVTVEDRCLYFGLNELPNLFWKVDLQQQIVSETQKIDEQDFYSIVAPAWQVARVLNREMYWEDFCLSFRSQLQRVPDTYSIIWNLFLFRNPDELAWAIASLKTLDRKNHTCISVTCPTTAKEWKINRYCPHQGADLINACIEDSRYLICPRHGWKFDLENEGRLTPNGNFSVNAKRLLSVGRTRSQTSLSRLNNLIEK